MLWRMTRLSPAPQTAQIVIEGEGFGSGFADLIAAKARRLSLVTRTELFGPRRIALSVAGHPALIDMLAIACLLGPREALVRDVDVRPAP
jgi:hypothetical protein